jgi:hypothetical protein
MTDNPYLDADREMLDEVIREAESYLAAQLQSGIAADSRAVSFVSLMAGSTAVSAAAGFAILQQTPPDPLGYPALVVAGAFLISMAFASWSARPSTFWYVGNTPSAWLADIRNGLSVEQALAEQAAHYDEQISDNAKLLKKNGRWMVAAIVIAWLGLAVGGAWAAIVTLSALWR